MSILAALIVSRHLISFLISVGVTGLKIIFSFPKMFCPFNLFYTGVVTGGGGPTMYLQNILRWLLTVLASVFSPDVTMLFFTRAIITSNKTFVCKKCLTNFQKLLLGFVCFLVILFKGFFKDFLRNNIHTFPFYLYANTFCWKDLVLIYFSICFMCR